MLTKGKERKLQLDNYIIEFDSVEGALDCIDDLIAEKDNIKFDVEIGILHIWKAVAEIEDSNGDYIECIKEEIPETDIKKIYIISSYENKCKLLGENCKLHFEMQKRFNKLGFKSINIIGADLYVEL